MPYSQDQTVAAVESLYTFLEKLYLSPDMVQRAPAGGWEDVTEDALADLEKDSTVISLLKHLPYMEQPGLGDDPFCIGPATYPIPYNDVDRIQWVLEHGQKYQRIEPLPPDDDSGLPPHIVSLANGVRDTYFLLIDTEEGTVIWGNPMGRDKLPEAPLGRERGVQLDSDEWWLYYPAWPVEEFVEVWKDKFRKCEFVAEGIENIGEREPDGEHEEDSKKMEEILRRAGWPGDGEGNDWNREQAEKEWTKVMEENMPEDMRD